MKQIIIKAPRDIDCDMNTWPAEYQVYGREDARLVRIASRSSIDVTVGKIAESTFLGPQSSYYIGCPNFGVAIPGISTLEETYWIMEKLLNRDMPAPDAVTVAQVLRDMGDF